MKLCAYVISGNPVSDGGYTMAQLGTNQEYIAIEDSESVPTGYEDISSMENWAMFGLKTVDYKKCRSEISTLVNAVAWSTLTSDQKKIAADWVVVGGTELVEVYPDMSELEKVTGRFHKRSKESRLRRFEAASIHVFNSIIDSDRLVVITDIQNHRLDINYIEYGMEGTLEGDIEGLFDYVEARSGTTFASTGVASKTFTPSTGATMQQVAGRCMEILRDGKY